MGTPTVDPFYKHPLTSGGDDDGPRSNGQVPHFVPWPEVP